MTMRPSRPVGLDERSVYSPPTQSYIQVYYPELNESKYIFADLKTDGKKVRVVPVKP